MRQDATAAPPAVGATKQEIIEKLEVAFGQIAAELNVPLGKVRNIARRRHVRLRKSERKWRDQTICRLRREGLSNEEIAESLGLSFGVIIQTITRLIAEGKLERRYGRGSLTDTKRAEREEQIIKLRMEGHNNAEIAELLELSVSIINLAASKLIQEGRVEPLPRGRYLSDEERHEREELIIRLREEGFSNEEIAKQIELSVGTINLWIHQLIVDGRIKRRPRKGASWSDLENERAKTIIEMVKRRAPFAEIGDAIRSTRQRVQQLIVRITKEQGKEVFTPNEELWTAQEAADELKTTAAIINRICAAGEVSCRRRGPSKTAGWLIDKAGMDGLRTHPHVTQERVCVICGDVFILGGTNAITCSAKCSNKRRNQQHEGYADQEPTAESLVGWRKDLWQRLQSHRIPKDEEWLTLGEATQRTGLSNMQLTWLRLRNIVTIRPHPTKKTRGGRPMAMYAASEMEIARQLFEAHANRSSKPD